MHNPNFTREVGDTDVTAGRGAGQLQWYQRASEIYSGKTVLDVGCGLGGGLKLLRRTCNAVGLDRDERLVEVVPGIIIGDIESVPDKSYDIVVAIDVIEHVEDDDAFCAQLKRVSREGFFVTTPNAVASMVAWGRIWEFHPREYTPSELHNLLKRYGEVRLYKGKSSGEKVWEIQHPGSYFRLNDLALNSVTRLPARALGKLLPQSLRIQSHLAALVC